MLVSVTSRISIFFSVTAFSQSSLPGKEFIFKYAVTNLLTFLCFNLVNIEGVLHGSPKLSNWHVSLSKMALSKYAPLGVGLVLKNVLFKQAIQLFAQIFFQILRDVDRSLSTPNSSIVNQNSTVIATKYFKPFVNFFWNQQFHPSIIY